MRQTAGVVRMRDIERVKQMMEDNSLFELFPKKEIISWILRTYSRAYSVGVLEGVAISRRARKQRKTSTSGFKFEATRSDAHVRRFTKERLKFLKTIAPDLLWEEQPLADFPEFTEEEMELVLEKGL